jgi:hypothetical protein
MPVEAGNSQGQKPAWECKRNFNPTCPDGFNFDGVMCHEARDGPAMMRMMCHALIPIFCNRMEPIWVPTCSLDSSAACCIWHHQFLESSDSVVFIVPFETFCIFMSLAAPSFRIQGRIAGISEQQPCRRAPAGVSISCKFASTEPASIVKPMVIYIAIASFKVTS